MERPPKWYLPVTIVALPWNLGGGAAGRVGLFMRKGWASPLLVGIGLVLLARKATANGWIARESA